MRKVFFLYDISKLYILGIALLKGWKTLSSLAEKVRYDSLLSFLWETPCVVYKNVRKKHNFQQKYGLKNHPLKLIIFVLMSVDVFFSLHNQTMYYCCGQFEEFCSYFLRKVKLGQRIIVILYSEKLKLIILKQVHNM